MIVEFVLDVRNQDHHVDLKKLKQVIGADQKDLAAILDIAVATVKANKASTTTDKKAKPLLYALELLAPMCAGDAKKVRAWFVSPKVYWGGLSPLDMFVMKRGNAVIETLTSMIDGESLSGS